MGFLVSEVFFLESGFPCFLSGPFGHYRGNSVLSNTESTAGRVPRVTKCHGYLEKNSMLFCSSNTSGFPTSQMVSSLMSQSINSSMRIMDLAG